MSGCSVTIIANKTGAEGGDHVRISSSPTRLPHLSLPWCWVLPGTGDPAVKEAGRVPAHTELAVRWVTALNGSLHGDAGIFRGTTLSKSWRGPRAKASPGCGLVDAHGDTGRRRPVAAPSRWRQDICVRCRRGRWTAAPGVRGSVPEPGHTPDPSSSADV